MGKLNSLTSKSIYEMMAKTSKLLGNQKELGMEILHGFQLL